MAPPRKTKQKKSQKKIAKRPTKVVKAAKTSKASKTTKINKPRKSVKNIDDKKADSSLKQIPANVQKFLKDLQGQIQSGAVDLADWRSLGVGIMSRLGQVTEKIRTAKKSNGAKSGKTTTRKKV